MQTLTTKGITISVETFYQQQHSKPLEAKFIFAYRVTIQNNNTSTVQLLSRYWKITDSNALVREVEGDGVIGRQPILNNGESHQYMSWSHLVTEIGKMSGHYTMLNISTGKTFDVQIPEFQLIAPSKLS